MSGGGQTGAAVAQSNAGLPAQGGMQGLPAMPQITPSMASFAGPQVQQQIAAQAGAAQPAPAMNPNIGAFIQSLQTMQNARPVVPQMQAFQGNAAPITPAFNTNALAAAIQAQMAQSAQLNNALHGAAAPAPAPAPAPTPAPAAPAFSSTTGFVAPPGSMPQAQYLAQAAAAKAPINLVSNPNILTQAQAMQLATSPQVMATESQNAASPTVTVSWNGNTYIIPNNAYSAPDTNYGGGGG